MAPSQIRITGARITPVAFVDPPLLNTVGVHEPYALRAIIQLDTDGGSGRARRDLRRPDAPGAAGGRRRRHRRPGRIRAQRDSRRDRRAAPRRLPRGRHGRDDHHRQRGRPGVLALRGRLPRRAGPRDRPAGVATCSAARFATPCRSAPTCSTSGPAHPGGEPDAFGEALDPDGIVAQATPHHRRIRLHRDQTQGRRVPARGGDGGDRGAARGLPRPPAAARPQRRVDAADVGQGGLGPGGHPRVPRGPDARARRHGRGRPAGADAAGDQHVRRRVRPPRARCREGRRCGWCSPTTTTGAACSARGCWRASARPSASGCRCTPTPTWASALPRWCTSPAPRRTSPTPATPTGRGRPRRSSSPARSSSSTARWRCPTTPGLGVEIDEDALAALHEQYVRCGIRDRDDTGYMKTIDPGFEAVSPRW